MATKGKELSPDEARDKQRQDDRQAELDKQAEQEAAMQKFYKEQAQEAAQALRDQQEYEVTGIRKVKS